MNQYDIVLVIEKAGREPVYQPYARIQADSPEGARRKLLEQHPAMRDRRNITLEIQQLPDNPVKPKPPKIRLDLIVNAELKAELAKAEARARQKVLREREKRGEETPATANVRAESARKNKWQNKRRS